VAADRIMVVENLETFRDLERYRWINYLGLRVLVIFRGDQGRSAGDSIQVLLRRSEPVWAFMDFDPAGLGLAASLPRLERVILPPSEWLRERARGARAVELFEASVAQWGGVLNAAAPPEIVKAWGLLASLRAGVAQESMRSAS